MKINPLHDNTARLPQKMFSELNFFHSYAKLYTIQCDIYTQSCLVLNMVWLTSDSITGTWKLWKHSCDCCHYCDVMNTSGKYGSHTRRPLCHESTFSALHGQRVNQHDCSFRPRSSNRKQATFATLNSKISPTPQVPWYCTVTQMGA